MFRLNASVLGKRLHDLRIASGLTLQVTAIQLGYKGHGYLSEVESGQKIPTLEFMVKASSLFKVSIDYLVREGIDLQESLNMTSMLIDTLPKPEDVERLRLILSTFQDGSGQLAVASGTTLPGWRDFERTVALTFSGIAQENKAIFDVLIPDKQRPNVYFGISCKMRSTLPDTLKTGRVTIELSNSASRFWNALGQIGINQTNYRENAAKTGANLISLVKSWYNAVDVALSGTVDVARSKYLVLSWARNNRYQLHLFPLRLPNEDVTWSFPEGGSRLIGQHNGATLYEWYGQSGGQLKYYPNVSNAEWNSQVFGLEPLPTSDNPYGLLAKVARYYPEQWAKAFAGSD